VNDKFVTPNLARIFTWSFVVFVVGLVGVVVLWFTTPEHEGMAPVGTVLLLLLIVAGCAWLVTLGVIAQRLNRPWVAWTGLSLIFAPVGPLVAYPLMLRHVKTALISQEETMIAPR